MTESDMPDGCMCDPSEWDDDEPVWEICDSFEGNFAFCRKCSHEQLCHAEPVAES